MIFRIAETAIDPMASPRKVVEGSCDVCFSIAPVKRSSVDSPRDTLVLYPPISFLLFITLRYHRGVSAIGCVSCFRVGDCLWLDDQDRATETYTRILSRLTGRSSWATAPGGSATRARLLSCVVDAEESNAKGAIYFGYEHLGPPVGRLRLSHTDTVLLRYSKRCGDAINLAY